MRESLKRRHDARVERDASRLAVLRVAERRLLHVEVDVAPVEPKRLRRPCARVKLEDYKRAQGLVAGGDEAFGLVGLEIALDALRLRRTLNVRLVAEVPARRMVQDCRHDG